MREGKSLPLPLPWIRLRRSGSRDARLLPRLLRETSRAADEWTGAASDSPLDEIPSPP